MKKSRVPAALLLVAYGAAALLSTSGALARPPALAAWLHPIAGGIALLATLTLRGGGERRQPVLALIGLIALLVGLPLFVGTRAPEAGGLAALWPADTPAAFGALILIWAASYIGLSLRPNRVARGIAETLGWVISATALASLIWTSLSLTLIYGLVAFPSPPPAASIGLLLLGLRLFAHCRAHRPAARGEDVRVARIGIGFLVAVALVTTLVTLVALQTQIERSLYQQQRMTARNRELIFHYATERLYVDGNVLLKDSELARLAAQASRDGSEANRRRLFQRIQEQLPFRVVRAFRITDRDGKPLAERGSLNEADTLWSDARGAVELELKWRDGNPYAQMRLQLDLPGSGTVGELLIEQAVPAWEQLVSDTYDLGRTGAMTVCGYHQQKIRCFQSGRHDSLWAPRERSALQGWVEEALNGRTSPDWDPLITHDDAGRPTVLVYGPVGRVGMAMGVSGNGLAMLVSSDAEEFYEPVRHQWHRILPVVLAIVLVAGWALRRIVQPLIRALRDKETRFRELTELSSDCYWQMDAELRFSEIVGKDLAASGIDTARWLGHAVSALPLHNDEAPHAHAIEAAMQRREVFSEEVLRLTADDLQLRYLVLSGAPQYDARGRFLGYRGVGRNITRQRQAEERLRHAQKDLLRAERLASLGSLVAGVAHELNTPIGNCVTAASALNEEVERFNSAVEEGKIRRVDLSDFTAYVREAVHLLRRGLDRAAGTIRKFKEVAVDQSSDRRLPFDMGAKLGDIVGLLSPTLSRRGVALDASVPEGVTMDSYPGAIAQVVDNLVLNALTHAFEGRDRGEIHLVVEVLPDDRLRLSVRDNGVGMNAAVMDRIFEPFFTTRLGTGGSGLGLYIVRNIVQEVLAGTINVDSIPGAGTTFTLEFPRITPETSAPAPEALR
ncbi:sensor histidine kinase [Niveibacterium sp.]|uniref:sensor histidine kinase n=1 Tax=Niveibacterium sp. TaxID=2017444 RepID=UPI0035B4182F